MLYKKIFLFSSLFFLSIILSSVVCSANAITTIETNLSMSIADIIMIVVSCGLIIFIALDVRIAIMLALLIYTAVFILFTLITEEGYANFNPYYSGVAMMVCFVILCLGLLITHKRSNTPYNVV